MAPDEPTRDLSHPETSGKQDGDLLALGFRPQTARTGGRG
jgi:hypothetical protein